MDKKRKTLIGIILLLLVCIGVGIYFLIPSIIFQPEKNVFERKESVRAQDVILNANGNVVPEKENIPTEEVGKHTFEYVVDNGIMKRTISFEYEVIDTVPPVIELKQEVVEIKEAQPRNIQKSMELGTISKLLGAKF